MASNHSLLPIPAHRLRWGLHILLYGAALAAAAFALEWVDYKHRAMALSSEFYVLLIAMAFAVLGGWLGHRLTARNRTMDFLTNHAAIASLGISPRELDVLALLATGAPNKLIARQLAISPNTVKTHITRLFEKLEATSRTQAVARARELEILP